ncbi:MAG TPA: hypothetical protein PKL78_07260 [Anaerolineales bacterium]|nr:hypothetical protein [Anaerolineales bacterium]HNN13337.1 hypothetical protein [Anaerolineales bacterium]HNO31275.1 hypothetical protein [Anaerolineales bacterium]
MSILNFLKSMRGELKKSRFKIWLRAFLLVQFSAMFCVYFVRDIGNGYYTWKTVALVIAAFIPIGFLLSLLVPMHADLDLRAVTFKLDRFYLFLIWFLVIAKLIIGRIPAFTPEADFIMSAIIGIMFGRLSGIGIRVRQLKIQNGFIQNKNIQVTQ